MRLVPAGWPPPSMPSAYADGMLIQVGTFPLSMLGFLLTAFPRRVATQSPTGCQVVVNARLLNLPWLRQPGLALMPLGYLIGLITWASSVPLRILRSACICLTPRVDGKLG